jgi:hypothetical protein
MSPQQTTAVKALESGAVLPLPDLPFALLDGQAHGEPQPLTVARA